MYANDYDQMICAATIGSENNGASSWSGDVNSNMTQEEQTEAIKECALWPYVMNIGAYKCPTGIKGHMVTYTGMCSMNGSAEGLGSGKEQEGLYITSRDNINNPAERIVFLDIGRIPLSDYRVHYDKEQWFDAPSIRHGSGSTFVFADCHAEYYQWKGRKAIELDAENNDTVITGFKKTINLIPETKKDASDLKWIQKGCWGKLGYEPTF